MWKFQFSRNLIKISFWIRWKIFRRFEVKLDIRSETINCRQSFQFFFRIKMSYKKKLNQWSKSNWVIFQGTVAYKRQELSEFHTRYALCVKSVQVRKYFWSVFSCIRTECRKIRNWKNSVFGHFSLSVVKAFLHNLKPYFGITFAEL